MKPEPDVLPAAAAGRWWAYISTDDGDPTRSGPIRHVDGRHVIVDGDETPVTVRDATRTAAGAIIGRTDDGHEIVLRPNPRPTSPG